MAKCKALTGSAVKGLNTFTFELQQKPDAVVRMEKLNADAVRSRRVHVTFTTRRRTNSISGSAANDRATSGERLIDKCIPVGRRPASNRVE